MSPFTEAYVALMDGHTVRIKDRTGRLGTVVSLTEGTGPHEHQGSALITWDRGNATSFRASKFNADLRVIVVPKAQR